MGDIEKGEYETRRAGLRAQMAQFVEADAHGRPKILDRLQRDLLDAGRAWDDADSAQRNRLARALFEAVIVLDGQVTAVRPRPEFQPYFVLSLEKATPPPNGTASTPIRAGGPEGIRTRTFEQPIFSS